MAYDKQGRITRKLIREMEILSPEEFDKYYEQLDWEHQMKVDEACRRFADSAIGCDYWDSDD